MDYRASLAQQQQAYVKTAGFYGWLRQHRRLWLWLTFISVALVIELPFLLNNQLFGGWDQQFHVNRIEELYRAAQQGMWRNAISTFTFRQAGLGIQIFYPYLFLYPYALLRLLGIPGISALYLGNLLYIILGCWIAYWCMLKFLQVRQARRPIMGAYLFAVLYNLSGYLVFNEMVRFDLPEAQSMMWYPLLFLGLYLTLKRHRRGWLLTTLGAVMLVYTHVLSAALAAGMVVVVLALGWRDLRDGRTWLDLALTGLATLVISLPELLPMLKTSQAVTIASPKLGSMAGQAISPLVAVGYGLGNVTKTGLLTHGVTLGTIILMALVATWVGFRHLDRFGRTMTILNTLLFWATTKLFPWQLFEHTPVRILQHPWRFYTFISFFTLVVFVLLIDQIQLQQLWRRVIVSAAMLLTLITSIATVAVSKPAVTASGYHHFATAARYFDYAPKRSLPYLTAIYRHQAIILQGKQVIAKSTVTLTSRPNGTKIRVPAVAQGRQIDLPFFNYGTGYRVMTDQGVRLTPRISKRGTIQVTLPRQTRSVIIQY